MAMDDTTLSDICERVANGESLTTIAPELDLKYTRLLAMIRSNEEASKHYDQALKDRDEWAKERVLAEIRMLTMLDITKLYDEDNCLLPMNKWPKDMGRAVAAVKSNELFDGYGKDKEQIGMTREVKLWNKEKSLELIGKNLHLFTERVNIEGKMTLEDLLDKTVNRED